MGFWDALNYTGDLLKRITPDMSTVKLAGVDAIQKLPDQYWPDHETIAQIRPFATTLAKNTSKYVVYEGFKHLPGATVASKLVSDSMREVKQKNHKDRMISIGKTKVDKLEKDMMKSTSPPENLVQNEKLSCEKTKDMTTTFIKTDLIKKEKRCFVSAVEGGSEKTKDVINTFMKNEFVGNHMFRDLMVPRFGRIENTNE